MMPEVIDCVFFENNAAKSFSLLGGASRLGTILKAADIHPGRSFKGMLKVWPCLFMLVITGCGSIPQGDSVLATEQEDPGLRVEIANPGFELWNESENCPIDWSCSQHAGEPSFTFLPEGSDKVESATSMRIQRIGSQPWGAARQKIIPDPVKGQHVRLSARMKLIGVTGSGAGIMIVTSGSVKTTSPIYSKYVAGTSDWQTIEVGGEIPPTVSRVIVGIVLEGDGTLLVDDVRLAILPRQPE